jgi:hypothetical protein
MPKLPCKYTASVTQYVNYFELLCDIVIQLSGG